MESGARAGQAEPEVATRPVDNRIEEYPHGRDCLVTRLALSRWTPARDHPTMPG